MFATFLIVAVPAFVFGLGTPFGRAFVDVAALVFLWPALAVQAKRWHDRDKSAWWLLINLIPIVGIIWPIVENGFLEGTPGPNRYGDNPLSVTDEA